MLAAAPTARTAHSVLIWPLLLAMVWASLLSGCRRKDATTGTATLRGKVVSANGRILGEVSLRVLTPEKTGGSRAGR